VCVYVCGCGCVWVCVVVVGVVGVRWDSMDPKWLAITLSSLLTCSNPNPYLISSLIITLTITVV